MSFGNALSDVELLARLIAFDSVSANSNRPIADFLAEYLSASGCRIWRQEFDEGRKVNILASRGDGPAGAGLLLSGHMDVVPAGEPGWRSDPFTLTEREGRLFGRGTCDMKGWLALAVNRVAAATALSKPLHLLISADEEVGCVGARHFARNPPPFPLPASFLIGEPTELKGVRMHKGHTKVRVRVEGKPAHSGYPHLGINAIERAGEVLAVLTRLACDWKSRRAASSEHFPECPYPVLNLATIAGGSAVNVVPAQCEIQMGVRTLPGEGSAELIKEIAAVLAGLPQPLRDAVSHDVPSDNPPMLCPDEAPLHRLVCDLIGQAGTVGVSYASDAGWLSTMGVQCVLHGPGSIEDAHKANESIDGGQWRRGGDLLDRTIAGMCGS